MQSVGLGRLLGLVVILVTTLNKEGLARLLIWRLLAAVVPKSGPGVGGFRSGTAVLGLPGGRGHVLLEGMHYIMHYSMDIWIVVNHCEAGLVLR